MVASLRSQSLEIWYVVFKGWSQRFLQRANIDRERGWFAMSFITRIGPPIKQACAATAITSQNRAFPQKLLPESCRLRLAVQGRELPVSTSAFVMCYRVSSQGRKPTVSPFAMDVCAGAVIKVVPAGVGG